MADLPRHILPLKGGTYLHRSFERSYQRSGKIVKKKQAIQKVDFRERCLVLPHSIQTAAALGRSTSATVAVVWTFFHSRSTRTGLVTKPYRSSRQASGTITVIGACPVVAFGVNT